jgi:hypothetical protein
MIKNTITNQPTAQRSAVHIDWIISEARRVRIKGAANITIPDT